MIKKRKVDDFGLRGFSSKPLKSVKLRANAPKDAVSGVVKKLKNGDLKCRQVYAPAEKWVLFNKARVDSIQAHMVDKVDEIILGFNAKLDLPEIVETLEALYSFYEAHIRATYEGTKLLRPRLKELKQFESIIEKYRKMTRTKEWRAYTSRASFK